MKFLHTADWQIGMRAAHVGAAATRVREERLAAARRVIDAARSAQAEFVVVCGDTFEDNGVDRGLVQKVADILAGFGGPVYVIPGNHDPLMPGSVWEHPAWRSSDNVRVLREETPIEVSGGTLSPCPAREQHSGKDPTAWIPAGNSRGIRVGLAHGTVEGVYQEEPDYPIARDAAARAGLDYLAIGHWHSTATYPAADGTVRMAYSGTHETTKFGERDSGNALIVEIATPGAPPVVTSVRTGGLTWSVIEGDVQDPGDLARLRQRIEALENPGATLLDLRVAGLLSAQDRDEPARIEEILASRSFSGALTRRTCGRRRAMTAGSPDCRSARCARPRRTCGSWQIRRTPANVRKAPPLKSRVGLCWRCMRWRRRVPRDSSLDCRPGVEVLRKPRLRWSVHGRSERFART